MRSRLAPLDNFCRCTRRTVFSSSGPISFPPENKNSVFHVKGDELSSWVTDYAVLYQWGDTNLCAPTVFGTQKRGIFVVRVESEEDANPVSPVHDRTAKVEDATLSRRHSIRRRGGVAHLPTRKTVTSITCCGNRYRLFFVLFYFNFFSCSVSCWLNSNSPWPLTLWYFLHSTPLFHLAFSSEHSV